MRSLLLVTVVACGGAKPAPQPVACPPEAPPGSSCRMTDCGEYGQCLEVTSPVRTSGRQEPSPKPMAIPRSELPPDVPASKPTGSFAKQFVDAHNRFRAKHCAPPLTWSKQLEQVAQNWANHLRDDGCTFGHSNDTRYGENLAAGTIGALDPETTVTMWYDEIKLYKFPDGGFSMKTGHFTQVVWKGTTQVGCGHSQCKGNDIWVCNYSPPGNWERQYRENVLPAGCR